MVRVRTYLSAKSLGSERAQAAMFSWIVDIYIQIPCHIVLLGRPWISAPRLLQLEFTIVYSLSYVRDLFQVLPTPFVVISTTNAATRRGHIWCDVKLRLRHTSRDEQAQALCVNFVLQATNAQGLGTRLRKAHVKLCNGVSNDSQYHVVMNSDVTYSSFYTITISPKR